MITKDNFEKLNPKRRSGFNKFFIWPVVFNQEDIPPAVSMERVSSSLIRLSIPDSLMKGLDDHYVFGSDVMLECEDSKYCVAFGYFNKRSGRDYKKGEALLKYLGIKPIPLRSESIYSIALSKNDYNNYVLREYRAGAEKFQSYFKDDHYVLRERLIEERLENDWKEGIRPYQILLHRPNSDEISVYGNGLIFFSRFEDGLEIANKISQIAIRDHKAIVEKVKNVKISVIPDIPIQIIERAPFYISIDSESIDKEKLADKLIKYLGTSFTSYGGNKDDGTYHFNLQRELSDGEKISVTSSYAVSIQQRELILNPTTESSLADIIEIYYGIERFFRIKENWLDI
ncbi:MAG: hypothetical protein ACYCSG_01355 [Thermoplasmataceae archaeon]